MAKASFHLVVTLAWRTQTAHLFSTACLRALRSRDFLNCSTRKSAYISTRYFETANRQSISQIKNSMTMTVCEGRLPPHLKRLADYQHLWRNRACPILWTGAMPRDDEGESREHQPQTSDDGTRVVSQSKSKSTHIIRPCLSHATTLSCSG